MNGTWPLVSILIMVSGSALAVAGLMYSRRSRRFASMFDENEVAGLLFSVMGLVYGALLAFIVFATWETYSRAEQSVVMEAATAVQAYRDIQAFPEPQRSTAQAEMHTYLEKVMATEWESHGLLKVHDTADLLNPLWATYRSITPEVAPATLDLAAAEDHLHQLELQRHLRHLAGESTLPWVFWPLLVIGASMLVVFSWFFKHASLRAQGTMTAFSSAMLIGVLLLIFSLNQPFTGPVAVSRQPMEHALRQFEAIDLPTP
ncbi:MAG: DUF4239 domain-containing protein [Chloroflexota bacterium]